MSQDTRHIIVDLEHFLTEAVRANYWLSVEDLSPVAVVRQILDELSRKRFIWLGNDTYVPSRMVVTTSSSTPEKLEELEVLFNSIVFTKYLYDYITESGYKLFEPINIEVRRADSAGTGCSIAFEWPAPETNADEVTVTLDEASGRILEVFGRKPQIPRLAQLTVISGHTYRSPYIIMKPTTCLGRLRNIIDKQTGEILRRNDFIFARLDDEQSPNGSVSRQHAAIVFDQGTFLLFDSGSVNGTSIERAGETIDVTANGSTGVPLLDGDIIRLGTALVRFQLDPVVAELVSAVAPEPSLRDEATGENLTTLRVSRREIEEEMRKALDTE